MGAGWSKTAGETRAQSPKSNLKNGGDRKTTQNNNKYFYCHTFFFTTSERKNGSMINRSVPIEFLFDMSVQFLWRSVQLLVSIRVGLKGVRIHDSLVVHQLVPFVLWVRVDGIVLGFPDDLMSFGDLNLSGFEEGCLDFVLNILTHHIIIELGLAFAVESEPSDLTFDVSLIGLIAVVFGPPAHKFFDVLILFQFTRKIAQVRPQVRVELTGCLLQVDDGICVVIQDTLP